MKKDLWGFKDPRELERDTQEMPDTILKTQIQLLGEKTGYVLYGKPTFIKVRLQDIDYKVATVFDVVVPALDDYAKTILIMYSNPETEFPVAISINNSFADDIENFNPHCVCEDKIDFEKAISDILSSEEVLRIIRILYSKASMLSK